MIQLVELNFILRKEEKIISITIDIILNDLIKVIILEMVTKYGGEGKTYLSARPFVRSVLYLFAS
jgi:hypothetical protein